MEWNTNKELLQSYIELLLKLPKENVEVVELLPYLLINLAVCTDVDKISDSQKQLEFWTSVKDDINDIIHLTKEFLIENNIISS